MPIQDSDLLLIEDTSGVSKKIEASKLKANLAANTYNNHKLLVNKPDYSSRFVYAQNMQASVAPTDYMLVERAGVSYKVTGQQVIDYFPSAPAGAAGPITDVVNTTVSGAWQLGTTSATGTWNGVAYGDGRFVAVGETDPRVMYSTDGGDNWTDVTPPSSNSFRDIAYGGDRFLAIAYNNRNIMYSTNGGENWTEVQTQSSQQWKSVAYGKNRFVVLGGSNVQYSTDGGDSWVNATSGVTSHKWEAIAYGNNTFVAVSQGDSKRAMWSDDGSVWKDVPTPGGSSFYWRDIAYGNGLFVAVGGGGTNNIMTSPDGKAWSPVAMSETLTAIAFGGGMFTAINDNNSFTSTDTITWTKHDLPSGLRFWSGGIAYGAGKFVAVSLAASGGSSSISSPTGGGPQENSTLTLASDANLDLFTGGDAIAMVDSNGDVASYTPVTSTITNVESTTGYAYALHTKTAITGNTLGHIQPFNEIPFRENVPYGSTPTYSTEQGTSYYDLGAGNESGMSVVRPGGDLGSNPSLAWSDDGTTWLGAIFNKPGGIGPDNPIEYDEPHRYWCFWFTSAGHTPSNFAPDSSKERVNLTFASPNPDLKFFNSGDVVGEDTAKPGKYLAYSATGATAETSMRQISISDATYQGEFTYGTDPSSGPNNLGAILFDLKYSIANVEFGSLDNSRNLAMELYASDTGLQNSWQLEATGNTGSDGTGTVKSTTPHRFFKLIKTSGYGTMGFQYWGVDTSSMVGSPVSVIFTDTAANTMTVDGGAWTGSDGTSSGDAADRETQVTGPAKSGTGNFSGNTGAVVDVSNSNQEWISNDNRLGESFFIKSASTRTGLAILRTKAIANAQAWAADDNYADKQLVKHNGRYWFALSASYGNSPDATDTSEWFDLGAI